MLQNVTKNSLLGIIGLVALVGCNDQPEKSVASTDEKVAAKQQTQVAAKSQVALPTIKLQALPSSVNLDPCELLTKEELQEIGLPLEQHIVQLGMSKQLPNHSAITPLVGCKWRSVDQGTPLGWVHIQQIKGDFNLSAEAQINLGEAAWIASYQGRDQLTVKAGDRLVMVATQIPNNGQSEIESNKWIAQKVLSRLQQVTESTSLRTANAEAVGGPSVDICAASQGANPHELLQGNVAWGIPNIEKNFVPSQKKRPQEDSVSCVYSSDRRGAIYVNYLGADGVTRWHQHFEKNGTKVTFGGQDAYRDRKKLYIPMTKGGLLVEAQGIKYFTDEEIEQKINDIASAVLGKFK